VPGSPLSGGGVAGGGSVAGVVVVVVDGIVAIVVDGIGVVVVDGVVLDVVVGALVVVAEPRVDERCWTAPVTTSWLGSATGAVPAARRTPTTRANTVPSWSSLIRPRLSL
jgi:hypothetical protein